MPFNVEKCAHIAIPNKNEELFFGNALIVPASTQQGLGHYFSGEFEMEFSVWQGLWQSEPSYPIEKKRRVVIPSSAKLN